MADASWLVSVTVAMRPMSMTIAFTMGTLLVDELLRGATGEQSPRQSGTRDCCGIPTTRCKV
jgi:hypothetical protein